MSLTVLQALPALEVGGVERGTVEVAKALVECGHRSIVISGGGRLVGQLQRQGSEHIQLPIGKKSPFTLMLVRKLRALLLEQRVDILHARSRLPAWVAWLAWKNTPPATRPAFITTVHGPYTVNRYSEIMISGEYVIAVSEFIRDYILNNYPRANPDNITVIPRGVDEEAFPRNHTPGRKWLEQWRSDYPRLRGKPLITLPGRITRWKGHEDFITIMAGLRRAGANAQGVIAGGVERGHHQFYRQLKDRMAIEGLGEDITFLGHRDDMREILSVSDVVLSLAREPEAFGRTALEALSLGRPVIAYDHGGAKEVLEKLQPEGLVKPEQIAAVVERALRFLKTPPAIAANRYFMLQDMLSKTIALYAAAKSQKAREVS